jgi:predicted PhzF superfamily epimerase YddE/YHI9
VKSGNEVSVRVRADGFTPTNEVQILSGHTVVGQGTLSAGGVSIDVGPYSDTGTFALTVNYLGDATTTTGSGSVSVKVVKQTPSMQLTAPRTVSPGVAPSQLIIHVSRTT